MLKSHCKNSITVSWIQKSCIVYIRACMEQNYPRGFHKKDGKVIRVSGEIPEDGPIPSYLVSGPDLLDPGDASSWEDRVRCRGDRAQVGGRSK